MMNICIYCGSAMGNRPNFVKAAEETGAMIARHGWRLLYGGACCGLMGKVADAALQAGGEVHGIIPSFFRNYTFEVLHNSLTELTEVKTMAERKEILLEKSRVIVALPGSFGTMDELFETLVLQQLKQIDRRIFLLNIDNFYDPLLQMFDNMQQAGFLTEENRALLQVRTSVAELEKSLCEIEE